MEHAALKKMEIRIARKEDSESISELMRELGYKTSVDLIREKIGEVVQSDIDQVFVAVIDNQVVGCVSCHLTQLFHQKGRAGRITSLVVLKNYRNTGIGTRLVKAADHFFQSNGCSGAEVTSGDHRKEAHDFYQNQGYKLDERRFIKHYNRY